MHTILICWCHSKIFKIWYIFKWFIACLFWPFCVWDMNIYTAYYNWRTKYVKLLTLWWKASWLSTAPPTRTGHRIVEKYW